MEENKLLDTSSVIKFFKDGERISGYVTIYTVIEFPPILNEDVKIIYPSKDDYKLAIKWQIELRKRGNPLSAIDLIVASIARNKDLNLITLDKDFKVIEEIDEDIKITILEP